MFLLNSCGSTNLSFEELSVEFKNPPVYSRPGAFWCWLNGNMSKEAISRDLREMSEKGMGRAEIWDVAAANNKDNYIPAGPAFLSDSSVAMIKYAFAQGKKYGIKIGMIGSSGWNAGGTWVEPEWASKQLYFSELIVEGPVKKSFEIPFPEVPRRCPKNQNGKPLFFKEVAVLAFPYNEEKKIDNTKDIIDLSNKLSEGIINVDLPEGIWKVMRFICSNNGQMLVVPSPNSNGLFIDFFDPESTKKHLRHFMDRLGISRGEKKEGGLAYLEFDSMELAEGIPWTDSMPEIFKKGRGYDLIEYLPVLAGWSVDADSDRFIYDWKKTISDQLIFSHYTTGRKFLEEYGIDLVAEAGGPGPPTWSTCPVDALKALGNVTIPRGEFWVRHRNIFLVKEVASASHIYGRNIVDAESFTTWRRWKDSPDDLKKIVDRAFCEGLNCVTFHTFASTSPEDGLPGRTYHAGSDINTANTWWNKSKPFMDYLSRCSYMLQKGLFVADACYYYGDQAPNFWPAFHVVPEKIIPESLGKGYDYDVVNSDVILNRMSVKDGRILMPDGLSYALLVLPDQDHIPLNVLLKLEAMVKEGATIIGRKPVEVPYLNNYLADNIELAKLVNRMWEGTDGEGKVISGISAREVLSSKGIDPDFIHESPFVLDYIHRQSVESDIYFIRNTSEEPYSGDCTFRVTDKYPELWDPSTGKQHRLEEFTDKDGRISMYLNLDPAASVFVVFNENKRSIPALPKKTSILKTTTISGSWALTFPEDWGAPEEANFDKLISWTDSDIEGIKYFSGTASYLKTITIQEEDIKNSSEIVLDLGEVCDVAEVYLNSKSAGILWKAPYRLNITEFVQAGDNELRIEIVNQWVNRLTGDMLSDPADRFCRTNMPYVTSDDFGYDNWIEDSDETFRLKASGLLGPVKLINFSH
ncbi:glycosyl hydrolase [Bacteroidota bacterium]